MRVDDVAGDVWQALHHGVPFFVAAPISTLDPATAHGKDIVIEDRPSTEITHSLGVRVAADLPVWNPSFDVTPGGLIAGIITEKGVVGKNPAGAFAVGEFVKAGMSTTAIVPPSRLLP